MIKRPFKSSALIICIATLLITGIPSLTLAFGNNGCAEGKCAECHSIDKSEAQEILKDLVTEVHGVDFSEVPGLYIIDATGRNGQRGLLFMDFSKRYVVAGNFINISEKRDISGEEIEKLRHVDPTTIPLTDSLVMGDPGGHKKIILFTDPKCPFCKKLHPELKKVIKADPDVVFFVKMMPLVKIHPDAYRISEAILCEKDLKLLEDSFADKPVPDPACESDAVDKTLKLAQELGINSTPTLILPDGRIMSGYRSAEDILKLLKEKKP